MRGGDRERGEREILNLALATKKTNAQDSFADRVMETSFITAVVPFSLWDPILVDRWPIRQGNNSVKDISFGFSQSIKSNSRIFITFHFSKYTR